MSKTGRIALSVSFIALGALLSFPGIGTFIVGPTKVFPFQHTINALSAIILGPWYSVMVAVGIGVLRNQLATGTIFAFPGGIPGAIVVALMYWLVKKSDLMALTEPIGTGIGALISAVIVAPAIGAKPLQPVFGFTAQWQLFLIAFWASSVPGSIIGYLLLVALRKRRVLERLPI